MRARDVFMESLVHHGVELIFGNPGTAESAVVDALPDHPSLGYVLALHEGVAMGAATFYALAGDKPAVVNLHSAPGLGNAIGMMYGALKANAPVVVTSGQPDTRLRLKEPLLGHDLVSMAAPVTKWAVQVERPDEMALIMRRAFKIANDPPRGPVFVSLPMDVMEGETGNVAEPPGALQRTATPDAAALAEAVRLARAARSPAILAGDDLALTGCDAELQALSETLGAPVFFESTRNTQPLVTTLPTSIGSIPVDGRGARAMLAQADFALLIGGRFFEELWFNPDPMLPPGCTLVQVEQAPHRIGLMVNPDVGLVGDLKTAMTALTDGVAGAADDAYRAAAKARIDALAAAKAKTAEEQAGKAALAPPKDGILLAHLMATLRDRLPADTIVVDESITSRLDFLRTLDFDGPGSMYGGRGGGIGQGIAGAIGLKLAQPDRPVICTTGDGSAMYSIQSLWTAAHHDLAIVFVVIANREYRVLKRNLDSYRRMFGIETNRPHLHMDLVDPYLDFVSIARGMGVEGQQVTTAADFSAAIVTGLASGRPYLIEAITAD